MPTFVVTIFTRLRCLSREKEKEERGCAGTDMKDSPYQRENAKSVTNLPNSRRKEITASVLPAFTEK